MCTNVILVRILVGKSCARSPKVAGMKKALKHKCFKASCGGDKRDRTADLLNAIQALSQLSYTPTGPPIQSASVIITKACPDVKQKK